MTENYIKEVIISIVTTDYNWIHTCRVSVDAEFWRADGTYREYDSIRRKNLRNLIRALRDSTGHHETCAGVSRDVLTIHFKGV